MKWLLSTLMSYHSSWVIFMMSIFSNFHLLLQIICNKYLNGISLMIFKFIQHQYIHIIRFMLLCNIFNCHNLNYLLTYTKFYKLFSYYRTQIPTFTFLYPIIIHIVLYNRVYDIIHLTIVILGDQ